MTALKDFSFLWDGSEAGWYIQRTSMPLCRVVVFFGESGPTLREVGALWRLMDQDDELDAPPLREAKTRWSGLAELDLGEHSCMLTRRWVGFAEQSGLTVKLTKRVATWHGFVNSETNRSLVIEDDELAAKVAAHALEKGVLVVPVEAD